MANSRLVRFFKLLKVVSVNLLLLFVLLEIVSLGFYFLKTRNFFYPRNKERIMATATGFVAQPDRDDLPLVYQLHPYFGFVHTQQTYVGLPFKKTSQNQFIIGVFGGSVARHFYSYELQHHVLAEMLQALPQFRNKEIVVLKFTNAAHKQPQQLLILNYFLSVGQELDVAINIDGFNEVALSYLNNKAGIEVSMPNSVIISPLINLANKDLSSSQLELALEVLQLKNKVQNTLTQLSECRIATCYLLRWSEARYFSSQYLGKSGEFNQLKKEAGNDSLVYLKRTEKPLDDPEALERIVELWFNSSLAMNDLLAARRIPYFEFIQPNQYYPTNRQFSEAEKQIAFSENSPFKEGTIKGYPKLLAKVSSLQAAGVKVFNGVTVFDETRDIVYFDNCCHYNDLGDGIFSRYIAQSIVTSLNSQPPPK